MPITIQRILCPVDFSDTSRRALQYALELARQRHAEVSVLHVAARTLPPLSALAAYASAALGDTARAQLRQDLVEELRRFVGPNAADVRVTFAVEEGHVAGTIVETAGNADLLVLGTHGHGEVQGLGLGSVTEKALHASPCPVLTIPPAAEPQTASVGRFARLLCPIDFSPASEAALTYALDLAREADGRVILLHVVEALLGDKARDLHLDVHQYVQREEERARERLQATLSPDDSQWQEGPPVLAAGRAHTEILRGAEKSAADVIVMGVHGQTTRGRFFGSTARHVVRGAPCPVLCVRPSAAS